MPDPRDEGLDEIEWLGVEVSRAPIGSQYRHYLERLRPAALRPAQCERAVGAAMGGWAGTAAIWASRQAAQRPWLTGPEDSPAGDSRALHHAQIASM